MKDDIISTATKKDNSMRKRKIVNIIKKIVVYTMVTVGVLFLLAIAYQVLEFLFQHISKRLFRTHIHPGSQTDRKYGDDNASSCYLHIQVDVVSLTIAAYKFTERYET